MTRATSNGAITTGAITTGRRDPTIDLLRAVAIVGVVLGHWLITALCTGEHGLQVVSPLTNLPHLTPLTWVLQSLALFFFAGGYGAARSTRRARPGADAREPVGGEPVGGSRLRRRVGGLLLPIAQLVLFWAVSLVVLGAAGVPAGTLVVIGTLVASPLWFLGVYVVLSALEPLVRSAHGRFGPAVILAPVGAVAIADLVQYGPFDAPSMLDRICWGLAVVLGWLVPFQLGHAVAEGELGGRRTALGLLGVGLAGGLLLLVVGHYPASMVGVTGVERSNLNPPSLLAVALGLIQIGLFLLLRPRLARMLERARMASAVTRLNVYALPIFLWHQTALLAVLICFGGLDGLGARALVGVPDDAAWLGQRVLWIPAFLLALTVLVSLVARTRSLSGSEAERPPERTVP